MTHEAVLYIMRVDDFYTIGTVEPIKKEPTVVMVAAAFVPPLF